jgi:hypothetical protein
MTNPRARLLAPKLCASAKFVRPAFCGHLSLRNDFNSQWLETARIAKSRGGVSKNGTMISGRPIHVVTRGWTGANR